MIYIDSSVVVAELLVEGRHPEPSFWRSTSLISSRLLEYEAWNRLNARALGTSHGPDLHRLLAGIAYLELEASVLARALEPFPIPVRTLDGLHLASMLWLVSQGQEPALATYDARLATAATALGLGLVAL